MYRKLAYGYNNNSSNIDLHFGMRRKLIGLVQAAHNLQLNGKPFPMRIILDVVIHNSCDDWA